MGRNEAFGENPPLLFRDGCSFGILCVASVTPFQQVSRMREEKRKETQPSFGLPLALQFRGSRAVEECSGSLARCLERPVGVTVREAVSCHGGADYERGCQCAHGNQKTYGGHGNIKTKGQ